MNAANGSEPVNMWTQGDRDSWHYTAGTRMMIDEPFVLRACDTFPQVVSGTKTEGGLGVVAINTVAGTAEASARQIATDNPDALPQVVRRADVAVSLAIMSSEPQDTIELAKRGPKVSILGQWEAMHQCRQQIQGVLPKAEWKKRTESTAALREVAEAADPNMLAVGPTFAAESLGLHVVGPNQVNPADSITSFYGLQRDPTEVILPPNPKLTDEITVLRLKFPFEEFTALAKVVKIMNRDDVDLEDSVIRTIPFRNENLPIGGGSEPKVSGVFFEIRGGQYSSEMYQLTSRVANLKDESGNRDGVSMVRLGTYPWYPKEEANLDKLMEKFAIPAGAY